MPEVSRQMPTRGVHLDHTANGAAGKTAAEESGSSEPFCPDTAPGN
ncbi:hypothetical protein FsymDg_4199 [Candidatus Protofrankia datiscae]|uniref:Uncharacterized protein n=1 Tax=Candidatus Protofrankia datiscae TaxID=2716812 RepID=F8AX15_9ACTN|nr:hypothetical protein FsymDg_4199 [Candidatus Protofrankia datiscae]